MACAFGVLALVATGFATAGSAATCNAWTGGGPNPQQVVYNLTQGDPDKVMAVTCVSQANDTNTINSSYSLFSMTGWTLAAKAGDETGGDGNVSFATTPVNGGSSSWSLDNPNNYSNIFITLKQANSFASFLLDTTAPLSGLWSTSGPGGSQQALSHASIYYQISTVPLPAGAVLILTALGCLGFARRRKS